MKASYRITLTLVFVIGSSTQAGANGASRRDAEARKVMFDYAACVVRKSHTRASDAVLSNATSSVFIKRYPDLINGDCLVSVGGAGKQLSFGGDLFRYALADALVNVDFTTQDPTDFSNKLPLAPLPRTTDTEAAALIAKESSPRRRAKLEAGLAKVQGFEWVANYGECIARHNPSASRLWLLTKPDGPEEISRINVMRPSFAACMSAGTQSFNKFILRGAVAISYYRLAMATPQAIPGKAL